MDTFTRLLAPLDLEEFRSQDWQRRPRLRHAPARDAHDALFRIEHLDDVLQSVAPNASDVDFFKAGSAVPQAELAGPGNRLLVNRLLGHFAEGGTIHVSNLQKYVPAVRDLCKDLQLEFYADVEADLWVTRENRFEPYLHFDRYDIFTLQVHGKKRWRLYAPLPIEEGRASAALDWEDVGEPLLDFEIAPGDLLYMPAYTPHVVTTVDPISVHVGLGVHPISYRELLEGALTSLAERHNVLQASVPTRLIAHRAKNEAELRAALLDKAREALEQVDIARLKDRVFDRFVENVTHEGDRHVTRQIFELAPIDSTTKVRVRDRTPARAFLEPHDGRACISFAGGGFVAAPATILPVFEFVASRREPFAIDDLPGSLDRESRIVLVRRLVDAGLCTTEP